MKKQSFIEGTFLAVFAIVISKILGMLYVIPFYSIIGEKGSILYSYAYNIYLIFLSISTAGLPNAICKLVSEYDALNKKNNKKIALNISLIIISILSFVCFLLLMIFPEQISLLIRGNIEGSCSLKEIAVVIRTVAFSVFLIPFLGVVRGYLQGHNFIKPISFSQVLEQIVRIFVVLFGSFFAIKVLNSTITFGVAIAVSGAFVGGLFALLYLLNKLLKNKKQLSISCDDTADEVSKKEIIKKLFLYSIPFIVINITVNIYNTVDMSLIIRTLSKLGYSGSVAEYVGGVVTTWGYKLNSIVTAIATGLTVSLIPNIVHANAKKDYKEVNSIFNKALQIILIVSIPMTCGLSFLAYPVWNVFYGYNQYGYVVFSMSIFTAAFCNIYLIAIQAAQSLNHYRSVYRAVLIGFVTNAVLDTPLMILCNYIGLPAFYGASFATIIGYMLSIFMVLRKMSESEKINYKETLIALIKIVAASVVMIFCCYLLKVVLPFEKVDRISSILYIIFYAILGGGVYFLLVYKMGLLKVLFNDNFFKKFTKLFGRRNNSDKD